MPKVNDIDYIGIISHVVRYIADDMVGKDNIQLDKATDLTIKELGSVSKHAVGRSTVSRAILYGTDNRLNNEAIRVANTYLDKATEYVKDKLLRLMREE